ncbi:MAG: cell division protein FtsZ [Deltaproteobacteria bacterium]|nr:cell division protein FtsZ [Deltaproteobacteria bacterium]
MMSFELIEEAQGAKIKVVGLGGAGGNAINNMIHSGLAGVEFIAANTDVQDLEKSAAPLKIQIGYETTRGLGTGANPHLGQQAAEESLEEIRKVITGADMVFITAGLGGGTGTGAGPVVAEAAKEQGSLTVAVVTKPFGFEGRRRMKAAEAGLKELKSQVDTVITIPNDRLLAAAPKNALAIDMFKQADNVLLEAVRGISDLIVVTGRINADFNDVRSVMSERGLALMGTGSAVGDDRAIAAANLAISNPLLEDVSISGARGVLLNITAGEDLPMVDMQEAASLIQQEADEDAKVIFGLVIDSKLGDELRVTVIATGIGPREEIMNQNDMRLIKAEAIEELRSRSSLEADLDTPTYLRESGPEMSDRLEEASRLDLSDTEIPTFLRRAAD